MQRYNRNIERALSETLESEEFWCGTVLRNILDDEYNDYLLTFVPWEKDSMLLINVTIGSSKKGFTYGGVIPVDSERANFTVNKDGFKYALGDLKNWFIINETEETKE